MAIMGNALKASLARSAEAKLRYEGSRIASGSGWQSMTIDQLGRWLFDQRVPGSPFTYIQYRNLARDVIRNARDAATMMANRSMTILDLGVSPGTPSSFPKYEYRSVVVGRNASGEEVWSTIHYTYSNVELNAEEVIADAQQQSQYPLVPPGTPTPPPTIGSSVVTIDVYIVSAGRKS